MWTRPSRLWLKSVVNGPATRNGNSTVDPSPSWLLYDTSTNFKFTIMYIWYIMIYMQFILYINYYNSQVLNGVQTSQCLLSGDTAGNAGPNSFQVQPGAIYTEKECDAKSIPSGAYPGETRPYASSDPYADPRPYPNPSSYSFYDQREPFPSSGIRGEPYPARERDPPYPVRDPIRDRDRDPYINRDRLGLGYPPAGRDPYATRDSTRDREFYPARDRDPPIPLRGDAYPTYHRDRDSSFTSTRNSFPPLRDNVYPTRDRIDSYPPSNYPGTVDQNYLDPDLSPYRCRHTITYEKIVGYTYNGARK